MSTSSIHIDGQLPPIIVHKPRQMRAAFKSFQKHGPLTKFTSVCGGQKTIPEGVAIKKCDRAHGGDPINLICGPNDRYYEGCRACGYLPDA